MRLADIEKTKITIHESKTIIKEHRSVGQILLELNVINIPTIDNFLSVMVSEREIPDGLKQWFISRSKKFIINSNDDNQLITNFSANAEPWMKKRQKEGVALYKFQPTNKLRTDLEHVLDWLVSLYNNAGAAGQADQARMASSIRTIKGLKNMSMSQAIEASDRWTGKLDATLQGKGNISFADEGEGIKKVLDVGDGYAWYELTTEECITREGHRVQNCLRNAQMNWHDKVSSGNTQLYSLRDKGNNPYVSIEVKNGYLNQVKGKQNRAPIPKYIPYVVPMLNKLNVRPTNEGSYDIKAMNILLNDKTNQYGTLFEISTVIDKSDKYITYGIDLHSGYSSYFFTDLNNNIIAKIDENDSRYRRNNNTPDLMLAYDRTSESQQKDIAEYIASVSHKLRNGGHPWQLDEYLALDDTGMLQPYNKIGEKLYDDGSIQFRRVRVGKNRFGRPEILYIKDGKKEDEFQIHVDNNIEYIELSDEKVIQIPSVITKLFNTKNIDLFMILGQYSQQKLFQNSQLKVSSNIADVGSKLAKSGTATAYQALDSQVHIGMSETDNLDKEAIYIVAPGTFIKIINEYEMMEGQNLTIAMGATDDVASVLNKLKIGSSLGETSLSVLEDGNIFYSDETDTFTTNPAKTGVPSKQYGDLSAIKTTNAIRVFDNQNQEIVRFIISINTGGLVRSLSRHNLHITDIKFFNKLKVAQNRPAIASILNEYEAYMPGGYDSQSLSKYMKNMGITFKSNIWKGPKTQPSKFATATIKGKKVEIYHSKTTGSEEYMFNNATDNTHIASLISPSKDGVYDVEIYDDSYSDIFAYAIKKLNDEGVNFMIKGTTEYEYDHVRDTDGRADKRHKMNFYKTLWKNGLIHHSDYGVKEMEEEYPSSTIARTKTGKWVKEVYNKRDPDINDFLQTSDYKNKTKPLVPEGGISSAGGIILSKSHNKEFYTFYRRNKPLLRIVVDVDSTDDQHKTIEIIYVVSDDNIEVATNISLSKFKSEIGKLMKILKLSGSEYLIDNDLYYQKGKLHEIRDNPKMSGYINGKIVYEDDHQWRKETYRDEWHLEIETETETKVILKVKVSVDGLESIEFTNKKIRKKPRLYQPHLNDLIDIVHDLYGGED